MKRRVRMRPAERHEVCAQGQRGLHARRGYRRHRRVHKRLAVGPFIAIDRCGLDPGVTKIFLLDLPASKYSLEEWMRNVPDFCRSVMPLMIGREGNRPGGEDGQ